MDEDHNLKLDGLVWESASSLEIKASHALLYDDNPLTFWNRVKIAWRYIWTGNFQDPRFIAHVEFPDEN